MIDTDSLSAKCHAFTLLDLRLAGFVWGHEGWCRVMTFCASVSFSARVSGSSLEVQPGDSGGFAKCTAFVDLSFCFTMTMRVCGVLHTRLIAVFRLEEL